MKAAQAEILAFPQQHRSSTYSDGYCAGINDGQKFAQVQFVWIGVAIGVVFSCAVALALIGWAAR